jgi:hypothetical protein
VGAVHAGRLAEAAGEAGGAEEEGLIQRNNFALFSSIVVLF